MMPEEQLATLEEELKKYKPLLGQAADTILDQEVSDYPIFVLHRQEVSIGIPLFQGESEEAPWSVNASTLEELATKKVVSMEKVEDFQGIYHDPREYLCLFVLSKDAGAAEFVFMPRASA